MGANVLIMAGGTGGHVFPALACAREFQNRGYTVHWLGTPMVRLLGEVALAELHLFAAQVGSTLPLDAQQ